MTSAFEEFVQHVTATESPDGWDFDPATETVEYSTGGRYCEVMLHGSGRNTIIAHGPKDEPWTEIEDGLTDFDQMIRWIKDQMQCC